MAETPDQTRREIEETRLKIAEAADELEERFKQTTDWKRTVNDYPIETVLAALGIGIILGSGVIFRAVGSLFSSGRAQGQPATGYPPSGFGGGIRGWIQPVLTPVLTAVIMRYVRGEQPPIRKAPPMRRE